MVRVERIAVLLGVGLGLAAATPVAPALGDASPAEGGPSRSHGWVYRGHLENGAFLRDSAEVHHVESFAEDRRFFGTPGLVGLLGRVSAAVSEAHGHARLNVGELSQDGGGDVTGHRSHESGRDVDVGFYLLDEDGAPVEQRRFVRINGAGRAWLAEGRRATFDVARNWALVEALVTDTESPVQLIFVARSIRRRLIRHARARRLAPELIERAEWVLLPPEGVAAHDDHFHVRVYCQPDETDVCRDRRPYWQWLPPRFVPADVERSPRYWPHE